LVSSISLDTVAISSGATGLGLGSGFSSASSDVDVQPEIQVSSNADITVTTWRRHLFCPFSILCILAKAEAVFCLLNYYNTIR